MPKSVGGVNQSVFPQCHFLGIVVPSGGDRSKNGERPMLCAKRITGFLTCGRLCAKRTARCMRPRPISWGCPYTLTPTCFKCFNNIATHVYTTIYMLMVVMAQVYTQTRLTCIAPHTDKKSILSVLGWLVVLVNLFVSYLINPYFSGYQP
jgi:hypothetical protein